MRPLLSLCIALYLVLPLSAARDFTANTSNYFKRGNDSFGEMLHGQVGATAHAWINLDTAPSGQTWTVVRGPLASDQGGTVGVHITDSGGSAKLLVGGRSITGDSFQGRTTTGTVSTGAWVSVGGVLSFSGDLVTPYLNGAADNGGAVTFASGTYQHTAVTDADFSDSIGAQINNTGAAVSGTQVDGRIAEVAVWIGDIGADNFAQLARGVSPLQVRPSTLIFYMPMTDATVRSIVSFTSDQLTYTVTGSLPLSPHVPILRHPGGH